MAYAYLIDGGYLDFPFTRSGAFISYDKEAAFNTYMGCYYDAAPWPYDKLPWGNDTMYWTGKSELP